MSERPIDRLDPGMSGEPVYEEPDYGRYEFKWEPRRFLVYWELNERLDRVPEGIDGKRPARNVTYGHTFTLDGARRKAFQAMAHDVEVQAGGTPTPTRTEDGNDLLRKVQARDLAERHV